MTIPIGKFMHAEHGRKGRALILRERWEVLAAMQADALALCRGYMERMEGGRNDSDREATRARPRGERQVVPIGSYADSFIRALDAILDGSGEGEG